MHEYRVNTYVKSAMPSPRQLGSTCALSSSICKYSSSTFITFSTKENRKEFMFVFKMNSKEAFIIRFS